MEAPAPRGFVRAASATMPSQPSTSPSARGHAAPSPRALASRRFSTKRPRAPPVDSMFDALPAPQQTHSHSLEEGTEAVTEGNSCAVCGVRLPADAVAEHAQSTLHLFKGTTPAPPKILMLCESNKGYVMLRGMGWKEEEGKGLGAHNQGLIEPVRTVLKRDRLGVGEGETAPPRVTHFAAVTPGNTTANAATIAAAVGHVPPLKQGKAQRKQAKASKEKAARAKEVGDRAFAFDLTSDFPEEYAALFTR